MSLDTELRVLAAEGVREAGKKARDSLMTSLGGMVMTGDAGARKLLELVGEAADLKMQTVVQPDKRAAYEDAYQGCCSRIRLVAKAEAVVKSDESARAVMLTIKAALDVAGEVALAVLSKLTEAAIQGLVKGLTEGKSL